MAERERHEHHPGHDRQEHDEVHESTAEREGIVDQQDAALEAIEELEHGQGDDEDPMSGEAPTG
jgi:hypothetical protein